MKKSRSIIGGLPVVAAVFTVLSVLPAAGGENIFDGASAAAWKKGSVTEVAGVLSSRAPFRISTEKSIPVEVGKVYTLSGEFRIAGAEKLVHFYFGIELLDAKGRVISHLAATPLGRYAIATVAEDVPAGATELVLDKADNWPGKTIYCSLVFNAKADRSDIPNFDSSPGIKQLIRENGKVKVVFAKPLNKAVKAGTAVRLHRGGNVFTYVGANNRTLNKDFQSFSGRFSTAGIKSVYKLFPGTAAVRPVIWTWSGSKGKLEFRNVKVSLEK